MLLQERKKRYPVINGKTNPRDSPPDILNRKFTKKKETQTTRTGVKSSLNSSPRPKRNPAVTTNRKPVSIFKNLRGSIPMAAIA